MVYLSFSIYIEKKLNIKNFFNIIKINMLSDKHPLASSKLYYSSSLFDSTTKIRTKSNICWFCNMKCNSFVCICNHCELQIKKSREKAKVKKTDN